MRRDIAIAGVILALALAPSACGGNGGAGDDPGADAVSPEIPATDPGGGDEASDVAGDAPGETGQDAAPDAACACARDSDCLGRVPDLGACERAACDADACACVAAPLTDGTDCDDGNPCTTGESCSDGACDGGQNGCECADDPDCAAHDDGDRCNGVLFCETGLAPYRCLPLAGSEVTCVDDDPDPCRTKACVPATGLCEAMAAPDGVECVDGDACTVQDRCLEGACRGVPGPPCDDGNSCTDEACDPLKGCVFVSSADPCEDGDPCTVGDACAGSNCRPGPQDDCDDADPCTADSCVKWVGCTHLSRDGLVCDDGDPCSLESVCRTGDCVATVLDPCDDFNFCTDDSCGPDGCAHAFNALPCDDGLRCTVGDGCVEGKCAGMPVTCDDGDLCTRDSCDGLTGQCRFESRMMLDCDDGDGCTLDTCDPVGGACGHAPVACPDDGNPCTDHACLQGKCTAIGITGRVCDDSDVCTDNDLCARGQCVGVRRTCEPQDRCHYTACDWRDGCVQIPVPLSDGNRCTDDLCDPATGIITYRPKDCRDGDDCTIDACDPGTGQCVFTARGERDDLDPCTDDRCDPATGTYLHVPRDCDDGDPCTVDFCQPATGACHGLPKACNDGDPCTADSCDAASGQCVFVVKGNDDADPCTDDSCDPATGLPLHVPVRCQDDDPCTLDLCDPATGACLHPVSPGAPCDDGSACTAPDACDPAGACVGTWRDSAVEGPAGDPSCAGDGDEDCDGLADAADPDCGFAVTGVSPGEAVAGVPEVVAVAGTALADVDEVRFGDLAGVVIERSATQVRVQVPAGASPGRVTVTVRRGRVVASAPGTFLFTGTAGAVDWANLQWPQQAKVDEGASVSVYGRVYEPWVTGEGRDAAAVLAQACRGPRGTLPWVAPGWTCVAAAWNANCAGCNVNDFEYQAVLAGLPAGAWDVFFRFGLDGVQFVYADTDGNDLNQGGGNGCTSDRAMSLDVSPP